MSNTEADDNARATQEEAWTRGVEAAILTAQREVAETFRQTQAYSGGDTEDRRRAELVELGARRVLGALLRLRHY